MLKTCSTCGEKKDIESFPPNRKNKDGKNFKCRECYNLYMRNWYIKNKEKHKKRVYSSRYAINRRAEKYGLTVEEINNLTKKYDGKCWLCRDKPGTSIDHCHKTGKVRGVLCFDCNTGLGKLGDDVEGLQRAIKYLCG